MYLSESSAMFYFYSRPCGRGDGAYLLRWTGNILFLLTPLREGRRASQKSITADVNFYSRPCGRGDAKTALQSPRCVIFLLTPLREGRRKGLLLQAEL